jgi:hypothetical protein
VFSGELARPCQRICIVAECLRVAGVAENVAISYMPCSTNCTPNPRNWCTRAWDENMQRVGTVYVPTPSDPGVTLLSMLKLLHKAPKCWQLPGSFRKKDNMPNRGLGFGVTFGQQVAHHDDHVRRPASRVLAANWCTSTRWRTS